MPIIRSVSIDWSLVTLAGALLFHSPLSLCDNRYQLFTTLRAVVISLPSWSPAVFITHHRQHLLERCLGTGRGVSPLAGGVFRQIHRRRWILRTGRALRTYVEPFQYVLNLRLTRVVYTPIGPVTFIIWFDHHSCLCWRCYYFYQKFLDLIVVNFYFDLRIFAPRLQIVSPHNNSSDCELAE